MIATCVPTLLLAQQSDGCDEEASAATSVDQGHPWRPPFGLGRVGRLPVAQVELSARQAPTRGYYLTAYRDGREVERHKLTLSSNPSHYAASGLTPTQKIPPPFFAHVQLASVPSEVVLEAKCKGRSEELVRHPVTWPEIEADAVASPDRLINPVDLGAILPPHDWLLLAGGQTAIVQVAAFSHMRDVPNARLRAWFDEGKGVDIALPLKRNQRAQQELKLPISTDRDRATLHVRLTDGERELWRKDIHTMVVAQAPTWPSFGAVEIKLRYDAPIVTVDSKTGAQLPSLDYNVAWDEKFRDVVVFLPNGSRFVFWRGSNYVPFWAGRYNTGVLYQWAEDCSGALVSHPDGSRDCPEPLFDSELRYSRVRIVESSASRVHVRWDYQLTDVRYDVRGARAIEDFYFYPDGFGTRVVTAPSTPGAAYQLSEFIIITPQAAYPFEVLPNHIVEALSLDGGKERIDFPSESTIRSITKWPQEKLVEPQQKPMLYRVRAHKDDPATAVYFHPSDPAVPRAMPPFYDKAQLVTPVYWGNHWPLNRGKWTGWAINDQITLSPAHNSVAGWFTRDPDTGKRDWEVKPLTIGEWLMPDSRGQVRVVNLLRFAWMIAHTEVSDEALRDWGRSFSVPPAVEVEGARLDIPSYSPERRALRLVAERTDIAIKLKPTERTVNPVFEIDRVSRQLANVTLDGEILPATAYAWDGAVLWIKASIGAEGATLGVQFQ